jgi:hypothetical protein
MPAGVILDALAFNPSLEQFLSPAKNNFFLLCYQSVTGFSTLPDQRRQQDNPITAAA